MIWLAAAIVALNFAALFLLHRLAVLRRRRMPSDAYFHERREAVVYTPNWDRVVAARKGR